MSCRVANGGSVVFDQPKADSASGRPLAGPNITYAKHVRS